MGCDNNEIIIRGTTPTIVIRYKTISVSDIIGAYLTIKQSSNRLVINKDLSNATIDLENNSLSWKLSQEETLQINEQYMLRLQCRYLLSDGTAGSSPNYDVSPYDILRDGVIQ